MAQVRLHWGPPPCLCKSSLPPPHALPSAWQDFSPDLLAFLLSRAAGPVGARVGKAWGWGGGLGAAVCLLGSAQPQCPLFLLVSGESAGPAPDAEEEQTASPEPNTACDPAGPEEPAPASGTPASQLAAQALETLPPG